VPLGGNCLKSLFIHIKIKNMDASTGSNQNPQFQLGLLHFAHVLMNVDGSIDQREEDVLNKIKNEENISDKTFSYFKETVKGKMEREIFEEGVELLNRCTEDQRLTAFTHLYQLASADKNFHEKEVRLLMYSLQSTNISFEDVKIRAKERMLKS
jgi:uncharacterized tellurite resistance protein B-like protein